MAGELGLTKQEGGSGREAWEWEKDGKGASILVPPGQG